MLRTIGRAISLAIVPAFLAGPAHAAMTISSAEITGGKLVITGKSPTGNKVSLDGKYTAKIDPGTRKFKFAVPYLPFDCKVALSLIGAAAPVKTAIVGKCGPAGPTLAGRRTWEDTPITLQASTTVTLDGFRFTPPTGGQALVRGRGSCTLAGAVGASTKFEIYAAESLAEVPESSDVAEIRVNEDADGNDHTVNWTFERAFAVSEGVAKHVLINYSVIQAAVTGAECVGSVTVEVFTQNLPLNTLQ